MQRRRNKPSLFEAISKGPRRIESPRPSQPGVWERWSAAVSERASQRAARRAEKAAARRAARVSRVPPPLAPAPTPPTADAGAGRASRIFDADFTGGRLHLSLNTVGCTVLAAAVCTLALAAYSAGRRSGDTAAPTTPVRALSPGSNPLLPPNAPREPVVTQAERKAADVDLSRLMRSPREEAEPANPPAAQAAPAAANRASTIREKPLQYLQIESFRVGRGGNRRDVLAEVDDVRRFLAARGIETACREVDAGFVLVSRQGFESTRGAATEFRRQVEQFGREYRKSGGRYEFKGCFFVSESALPGRPID